MSGFEGKPPAHRRLPLFLLLAAAALFAGACGERPSELRLTLVPGSPPAAATLKVEGIPGRYMPSPSEVAAGQWPSILRVTVLAGGDASKPEPVADLPAVAGRYAVSGGAIVFTPMFGFEPGLQYRAVFDPSQLPRHDSGWTPAPVVAVVGLPKPEVAPTTVVDHVSPTGESVPENQLRLYIYFSAPMGRKGGIDYVHLLDADGREVPQPFLPLEAEFWNPERTRYTVFFDPGRVKRGILPNEQLGRPLKAGRQYTLVVDREWRDGEGRPLKEAFRRTFKAGAADMRPLDLSTWQLRPAAAGSRQPLTVVFPEPLDHGLLLRALGVAMRDGTPVSGEVGIAAEETQWTFTPAQPWQPGEYQLVVLTILEDLAGNRIGRAFEVDDFEQVDRQAEAERVTVPFTVGR